MLNLGPRNSCREGFKKLDILTVLCLYINALMLFAFKNLNIFQTNSSVHGMNKRQQNKLHISSLSLPSIQRVVYYSSVKIFKQVPQNILKLCYHMHIFKILLRDYLFKKAFYFMREFLSAGHNDVDIWTFLFNLFDCVVMHMVTLNCCVCMISSLWFVIFLLILCNL